MEAIGDILPKAFPILQPSSCSIIPFRQSLLIRLIFNKLLIVIHDDGVVLAHERYVYDWFSCVTDWHYDQC